jgi:superfamily II DNA or RNA helicase
MDLKNRYQHILQVFLHSKSISVPYFLVLFISVAFVILCFYIQLRYNYASDTLWLLVLPIILFVVFFICIGYELTVKLHDHNMAEYLQTYDRGLWKTYGAILLCLLTLIMIPALLFSAFLETCGEMQIPAALERSRSGNGAHVWVFFEKPIPASLVRNLGTYILTRTMEHRHQIGLDSYDRIFPNQNTLPKGGFGNLIALPLQRVPRNKNNSVFLNEEFELYPDQWFFLSTLRKMQFSEVEAIVRDASHNGGVLCVRNSTEDEVNNSAPWELPPSKRIPEKNIQCPLPFVVRVVQSNLIYIEKDSLPSAFLNRLMCLAAFQNPEFYNAQAMRLSTFGKPRVISCAEDFPSYIGLPRGCLDEVIELFETHDIKIDLIDERFPGRRLDVSFQGELNVLQKKAAEALEAHDIGVLSAPTAFGKTVLAAWIIAQRKVNTLIMVHRRQLLDQWRERLSSFLNIPIESIGQIGGGKDCRTGLLDVGTIQSLIRKGVVKDLVADYGQVVVDECHHVSAVSFEQVLKQVKARYVFGLTATPVRKDGHHPIITMQCGPIRFRVNPKKQAALRPFEHVIYPRYTNFVVTEDAQKKGIQEIYTALIKDESRNDLIFDDILMSLERGRSPLLLTERTEHLEYFADRLQGFSRNILVFRGGMGKKQRQDLRLQMASISDDEERLIIATGRYIGEGFDDARLDTLFLAFPISWRGTLQQYAGRIHRLHTNKKFVEVFDYVDINVPVLMRMYEKRMKGYSALGYQVKEYDEVRKHGLVLNRVLF